MPLRFCFIMLLIMSGLVIICSCADFCSDFWLNTPVSCAAAGPVRGLLRARAAPVRGGQGTRAPCCRAGRAPDFPSEASCSVSHVRKFTDQRGVSPP